MEYWWFLLIDARSAFNENNRTEMIWDVRYEWPSGVQFIINFYRHWDTLVVHNSEYRSGHFLHIEECLTQ